MKVTPKSRHNQGTKSYFTDLSISRRFSMWSALTTVARAAGAAGAVAAGKEVGKLTRDIATSVSSNVVHIANGYHETIRATCTTEGSSKSSEFYIQSGEVKKHTSPGWTDGTTVNIKVEAGGLHLGTVNIASNRSIIIDKNGDILNAMYQRWWEKKDGEEERGRSYIWKCENGNWHQPRD